MAFTEAGSREGSPFRHVLSTAWLGRQADRLRRFAMIKTFGCAPRWPYLAKGLANLAVARAAHPLHWRPRRALGRELRQAGFLHLPRALDPDTVRALHAEFLDAIERPDDGAATCKDFLRTGPDGVEYLARRALVRPRRLVPTLDRLLPEALQRDIADYFGCDFYVSMVEAYRTYSLPAEAKGEFGKFMTWHLDTQQSVDILKLFVPLEPIEARHGPTRLVPKRESRRLARNLSWRLEETGDAELEALVARLGSSRSMTGRPGDCYFVETQRCLHSAGLPEPGCTRDLLILRLRPWTRFTEPEALKKGWVGRSRGTAPTGS